ncbi:hypothetical protein KSD_01260 [Ktedonobacter sp. SOSP1-85]|uniref:hypothetical protein n=1 Tax=Ktedonobacter sp. SOSP1-85 TaxID=2778367 RepID=UPI0019159CA4|nr:hypothetical protein [Ktedonobacter sp. SOSP1-85]GHO72355.1 hypothetical protein KSD_01260 [Ktedonobacter sp. SOSP1-85]
MKKQLRWQPRPLSLSLLALIAACCLFFAVSLPVQADTVRISDPVEVLNVQQVMSEGSRLAYPLDVYTTSTFSGTASDFVQRTISAHLTSKRLIVIAIDVVHRYFTVVGGSQVPLTNAQYTTAGQAFKNAAAGNHFTSATLAAIQSLESSLQSHTSSTSSGSGGAVLILLGIVVALVILGSIVGFIRRLLGLGGRPVVPQTSSGDQQIRYGDGRDNFGGGSAGNF